MKQLEQAIADKKCLVCKHAASDPDGVYCAHKESLAVSAGYGRSIGYARESICSGILWEVATDEQLKARGHTK